MNLAELVDDLGPHELSALLDAIGEARVALWLERRPRVRAVEAIVSSPYVPGVRVEVTPWAPTWEARDRYAIVLGVTSLGIMVSHERTGKIHRYPTRYLELAPTEEEAS